MTSTETTNSPRTRISVSSDIFQKRNALISARSVENKMGLILLILLLALIFGGLGFALHWLWIIAVVVFIVWLIGFAFRSGTGARWYRW